MSLIVDLKNLFAAAKTAKIFEKAPPIESTALDRHFPESVRQTYDSPIIPVAEINTTIGVVPVVARGSEPVPVSGMTHETTYIEPLPIYIEDELNAVELNNLKLMGMAKRRPGPRARPCAFGRPSKRPWRPWPPRRATPAKSPSPCCFAGATSPSTQSPT